MLKNRPEDIQKEFEKDLLSTSKSGDYDSLYLKYFSRTNGIITLLMKELPKLSVGEKKEYGPKVNELSNTLKEKIEGSKSEYNRNELNDPLMDLTIPLKSPDYGYLHPTTQTIRKIVEFFRYYGYSVATGPEIENAEFNFRKLNLPEDHPATDLQDTLFLSEPNIMLRTHTSSVESRVLSNNKPPVRVIINGKVYRNETASKTNTSFFHQCQGVVVDKGITIQHLKSTLEQFHKFLFGDDVELRFRYKYYPEVSPGMGVDMKCRFCEGTGCEVCKFIGYIEVLGCGMIHCNTLKMCGINPEIYTGFAFGIGLDRLVAQWFKIDDIRKLYDGGVIYT